MKRRTRTILYVLLLVYLVGVWHTVLHSYQSLVTCFERTAEQSSINHSALVQSWPIGLLVNRNDFQFVLLDKRCDDQEVFLVVFVHSSPDHFEQRRALRQTWARETGNVNETLRVVFMLGMTTSPQLQEAIREENHIYGGDVIQGNFIDSYRNLTYKHIMGLKWTAHFCGGARYVLKVDDDVFLDVAQLVAYLKREVGEVPPAHLLLCYLYPMSLVKRSHRSKWYVPVQEYPKSYYPPYCAGWTVVMSMDVVIRLYLESSSIQYFWVDDVVVTGILAQRAGVQHSEIHLKMPSDTDDRIALWEASHSQGTPYWFGVPNTDVATIYKLWDLTALHHNIDQKR